MFELSGVNYEEVLEQGDSILVRVIGGSSYRGFELSGLYCILKVHLLSLYLQMPQINGFLLTTVFPTLKLTHKNRMVRKLLNYVIDTTVHL